MGIDEDRTLPVVSDLARSENENSYWLAYRAYRNLVKEKPDLVIDMLGTDKYVYKSRKLFRKEKQS